MPQSIPVNFALQAYESRSKPVSAQQLVNLYPENNPQESKTPVTLHGTPGLSLFATVGSGPIYGMKLMRSLVYVVSGDEVYTLSSDGTSALLGTLSHSVRDIVDMAENGTQMVMVLPTGEAYVATTSSLAQITDADFPENVESVDFMDGYHIFSKDATDQFLISALNDATSYDPTDKSAAEDESDNIVRMFAEHEELWAMGEETIEVFVNTGNEDFPFERLTNTKIERGLAAKMSVAADDNAIFWLGEDRIVYRTNQYTPVRISTHAIEEAIRKYTTISDAHAFIYTQGGHKFYILTFPTEEATWIYDIATKVWHERRSFELDRWRVNRHSAAFGKNLVGDYVNGRIYELDLDAYTDNGDTIQRIAAGVPIFNNTGRMIVDRFRLDFEAGVGLTTGQGSDPRVMLEFSDDGGRTWSNEKWRDIGKLGKYKNRAVWRKQGQTRERVYRITVSDPVKVAISGAYVDLRRGGT